MQDRKELLGHGWKIVVDRRDEEDQTDHDRDRRGVQKRLFQRHIFDVAGEYVASDRPDEDIEADDILTDEMIDELMSDRKELKAELPKTQEERRQMALEDYLEIGRDYKERVLLPYLEKLGNCELVSLSGDHLIYEQKPDECGQIIRNFIDGLDQ